MTYSEYVNQPRSLRRKILHKIEDVRFKEAACMKSTATLAERTQTSFGNTAERNIDRYIDAMKEL